MSKTEIPVLMYHAVVKERSTSLNKVHVTVETFEKQMKWLSEEGYKSVTLQEMLQLVKSGSNTKFCVITFDDGYKSLLEHATPILKKYGFSATLFLSLGAIGKADFSSLFSFAEGTKELQDAPLTWEEVNNLINAGWQIESHSIQHLIHSDLKKEDLQGEMLDSKRILESTLHRRVSFYAFPFGKYNAEALKTVISAGYTAAVSVHSGLVNSKSDVLRLPRLEMNCEDSMEEFISKICTGFASNKEKRQARIKSILFRSPLVKDLLKKVLGDKMN